MKNYYLIGAALVAGGLAAWGTCQDCPAPGSAGRRPALAREVLPAAEGASLPETRAVCARLEAKERVVRALEAGDCTLLEAAARFRALDTAEPRMRWEYHPDVYAGDTEAERFCRAVIYWEENVVWQNSSGDRDAEAAAVVRRLEAELEGHRLCGTLTLPPVGEGP
jgi:hypothetical protein